jgi:hypothetical protein
MLTPTAGLLVRDTAELESGDLPDLFQFVQATLTCDVCGATTPLMLVTAPESADPTHLTLCLNHVDLSTLEPYVAA